MPIAKNLNDAATLAKQASAKIGDAACLVRELQVSKEAAAAIAGAVLAIEQAQKQITLLENELATTRAQRDAAQAEAEIERSMPLGGAPAQPHHAHWHDKTETPCKDGWHHSQGHDHDHGHER
jgi:hypothetical protein